MEPCFTLFTLILQQGTASEATLMSLLAARCKAIRRVEATSLKISEAEIMSKLVAYTSEQVCTKQYFQVWVLLTAQLERVS